MRTITTTIYAFNELSDDAKKQAIKNYRNKGYDNSFYFDEIISSVKKMVDLFNLKTGNRYSDLRFSHIDDDILQLSGVRLYKYILNNYGNDLFKPAYIKTIARKVYWRQFAIKHYETYKKEPRTSIYSRIKKHNDCVLTGVCYDNEILGPVYQFLKKPDQKTTFEDLLNDIESAISKTFNDCEEWINSDEFITDTIEANDYEFTEDGEII